MINHCMVIIANTKSIIMNEPLPPPPPFLQEYFILLVDHSQLKLRLLYQMISSIKLIGLT